MGFLRRNARWIILGVSLASVAVTILGLYFGFPFFAMFLFFPGIFGFGLGRRGEDVGEPAGGYCPECGSPVDPGDGFCRVCGRRLDRERHGDVARPQGLRQPRRVCDTTDGRVRVSRTERLVEHNQAVVAPEHDVPGADGPGTVR